MPTGHFVPFSTEGLQAVFDAQSLENTTRMTRSPAEGNSSHPSPRGHLLGFHFYSPQDLGGTTLVRPRSNTCREVPGPSQCLWHSEFFWSKRDFTCATAHESFPNTDAGIVGSRQWQERSWTRHLQSAGASQSLNPPVLRGQRSSCRNLHHLQCWQPGS
jgi:hypothetical protein